MLQCALPALLYSPTTSQLTMRGATNVSLSPPIDYTKHILLPFLKTHFGIECDLDIKRRGLSSGHGEVPVTVQPLKQELPCISLRTRGEIISFNGIIWSADKDHTNV
jgi:RNA 3'-terminal phosphate cyclase (ATP)